MVVTDYAVFSISDYFLFRNHIVTLVVEVIYNLMRYLTRLLYLRHCYC